MTSLGKSLDPSELEFISEETMVQVTPLFDMDRIHLITVKNQIINRQLINEREVSDPFWRMQVPLKCHYGWH